MHANVKGKETKTVKLQRAAQTYWRLQPGHPPAEVCLIGVCVPVFSLADTHKHTPILATAAAAAVEFVRHAAVAE